MDIINYIVVPIVAAILGGLIGGLFTFLGVKMTLTYEKKIREEERIEKNREINRFIIGKRPELQIIEESKNRLNAKAVYLIPYKNPKLVNEKTIMFEYTDEIFSEDYWEKYELVLKNKGERAIESFFLQLPYKSMVNIYSREEIMMWKDTFSDKYYQDIFYFMFGLGLDEETKIIVHYPRNYDMLSCLPLDVYMRDEDGNCWIQGNINFIDSKTRSKIISEDMFYMHLHDEYYRWFIYDMFYYDTNVKKEFKRAMQSILESRKRACLKRNSQQEQYISKVNSGEVLLKHNYPVNL